MVDQLEEAFGESFVKEFKQTKAERRQAREELKDRHLNEIADLAVNEGKLEGKEPNFRYETEEGIVNHAFLMQLPEVDDYWARFINELDSGAVTAPMDYMGEWMSCLFNNPDDLKQFDQGDYGVVIGELSTWEKDNGESEDQISPVRGAMTVDEAKRRADEYLSSTGPSVADEDQADAEEESEEDDDSSGGLSFGASLDDDEDEEEDDDTRPFEDSEVREEVNKLAAQSPEVWEILGDDMKIQKVVQVVCQELDVDAEEWGEEVYEVVVSRIEEEQEEEEDEEDDDEEALF